MQHRKIRSQFSIFKMQCGLFLAFAATYR